MKIVLRDDDICYYTSLSELECAFGELKHIPISLSVIPYAAYSHMETYPYKDALPIAGYPDIADYYSLVSYLKEGFAQKRFELMLHGINHEYYKNSTGKWETEMSRLSLETIRAGITSGLTHLENLFDLKISTFIGPSNDISANCAVVLDELGLNTNYMVSKHFNRHFSLTNFRNYTKCNLFRGIFGQRYAGILHYKNHQEICSFPFDGYEKAIEKYRMCKKFNQPLVIYSHYWSLNHNHVEKEEYVAFVKAVENDGAEFLRMSQLWD